MKKVAIILSLAGMVATSFGQGYISAIADSSTTVLTNNAIDTTGAATGISGAGSGAIPKVAGLSFQYALLTQVSNGPAASTSLLGAATLHGWQFTGLQGAGSTAFNGRFSLGTDVLANNAGIGVNNQWLVVGWSTSIAADWGSLAAILQSGSWGNKAGFYGASVVGMAAAGAAPPAAYTPIYGAGNPIGSGFTLNTLPGAVPEPTTFALAGLGAAAMLVFRRRK